MAAVCAALSAVCHTDDARVIFGEHLPFVRKMFLHFNDLDDAAVSTLAEFLEGQAVCAGGGADKGMLGGFPGATSLAPQNERVLECPQAAVGRVIGRGGETINKTILSFLR
mgnify:CR=1 FL=1